MTQDAKEPFAYWAILELMGHRRLAGYVQEAEIAGASFLRIDIYRSAQNALERDEVFTQWYSPAAVYAITPTTEAIARQISGQEAYQPVRPWEVRATAPALYGRENDDKLPFEDDNG